MTTGTQKRPRALDRGLPHGGSEESYSESGQIPRRNDMQKEERLVERATLAWIARTWDATVAQGMDDFPNLVVENFRLEDEVRRSRWVPGLCLAQG